MWEDRGAEAGGDSALLPEAPSTDATAVMEEPSQDTGPGSTDMEEWLSESGHLQVCGQSRCCCCCFKHCAGGC